MDAEMKYLIIQIAVAKAMEQYAKDLQEYIDSGEFERYLNRSEWSIFREEKMAYLREKIKEYPFLEKILYQARDIYGSLKKFIRDIRSGHFFRKFSLPFSRVAGKFFRRCK